MATLTRREPAGSGPVPASPACAVCGDEIALGEKVVRCPACGIEYHAECWSFVGGRCARLGCAGRLESARQAPAASPPPPAAPPAISLRLDESEIAAVEPQVSPTQKDDLITGCWATPRLAALTGGVGGLYLGLVFQWTESALHWEMGEWRLHETVSLHALAACNRASWWLWILGGGAYAILHRRYLSGKARTFYPLLRMILAAALLGSLSLGLGHLAFLLTYHWPGVLWGLPAALAWMPRFFAWALLGVALGRALAGYTSSANLFEMASRVWGLALALALNGTATAMVQGLIMHGIGWLAGSGLDVLVSGHHLATRVADTLGSWGTNVGFIAACIQNLFPDQARQFARRRSP